MCYHSVKTAYNLEKELNFILGSWIKYYTKEAIKALKIVIIAVFVISAAIVLKFKPAYEVKIAGAKIGYVENKNKIDLKIKKNLEDISGNIAFKEATVEPEYELKFISRDKQTQEKEVLMAVEDSTIVTYRTYAVTVDGEVKTNVESEEIAAQIVANMKADLPADVNLNVGIIEQFSTDFAVNSSEEASGILSSVKVAKIEAYKIEKEAKRKAEEEEAKKRIISGKTVESVGTIAGFSLKRPVEGSITSRYGSRSAIRSSAHTGLDIATAAGTPVKPIAPGVVTFAAYKGSYGNLVIIDHGNGVESYYAHCSQIYAAVGAYVDQNSVISAVGSTGNSTGPHLHLEIRQNGNPLNPENYLY